MEEGRGVADASTGIKPSQPRRKAAKGTVVVQVFKERLRLCWSYLGTRYFLSIGLPNSKVNRVVAEYKARQIELAQGSCRSYLRQTLELDIASGYFDATLKKYKPEATLKRSQFSISSFFELFWKEKQKTVSIRTFESYHASVRYLTQYFRDKPVESIDVPTAEQFIEWLNKQGLRDVTRKTYLTLIKAIWDWALKKGLIELNPWQELVSRVRVAPKQMPKPFTKGEIAAIIQAFKTDRYYHHYADYVDFLFSTGCRTSEVVGLRWRHLSDDCLTAWIGETLTRGVRKSTKTNRARTITLTPRLQELLLTRRPTNPDPEGLVFSSPQGGAIDDHNFRNRAWKAILAYLKIDYRKPYTTRHTLISHALDLGMNPVMVAALTGHDVETLYQNYAGNVNSRPMLPEL